MAGKFNMDALEDEMDAEGDANMATYKEPTAHMPASIWAKVYGRNTDGEVNYNMESFYITDIAVESAAAQLEPNVSAANNRFPLKTQCGNKLKIFLKDGSYFATNEKINGSNFPLSRIEISSQDVLQHSLMPGQSGLFNLVPRQGSRGSIAFKIVWRTNFLECFCPKVYLRLAIPGAAAQLNFDSDEDESDDDEDDDDGMME